MTECNACNNGLLANEASGGVCTPCLNKNRVISKPVAKATPKNSVKEDYIDAHNKSMPLSVILCVCFGPMGALYANPVLGLAFLILAITTVGLGAITAVLGAMSHTFALGGIGILFMIIIWLLSIMVSCFAVVQHNVKVKAYANFHHREP